MMMGGRPRPALGLLEYRLFRPSRNICLAEVRRKDLQPIWLLHLCIGRDKVSLTYVAALDRFEVVILLALGRVAFVRYRAASEVSPYTIVKPDRIYRAMVLLFVSFIASHPGL